MLSLQFLIAVCTVRERLLECTPENRASSGNSVTRSLSPLRRIDCFRRSDRLLCMQYDTSFLQQWALCSTHVLTSCYGTMAHDHESRGHLHSIDDRPAASTKDALITGAGSRRRTRAASSNRRGGGATDRWRRTCPCAACGRCSTSTTSCAGVAGRAHPWELRPGVTSCCLLPQQCLGYLRIHLLSMLHVSELRLAWLLCELMMLSLHSGCWTNSVCF